MTIIAASSGELDPRDLTTNQVGWALPTEKTGISQAVNGGQCPPYLIVAVILWVQDNGSHKYSDTSCGEVKER